MSSTLRRFATVAASACIGVAVLAPLSGAAPASSPTRAATWLASQLRDGAIRSGSSVNVADTAAAALALSTVPATQHTGALALATIYRSAKSLLAGVSTTHPGEVAELILAAHTYGVSATKFGGVNLVGLLTASLQGPKSADPGRFGSEDPTYDGTYRQGLALAALRAVGQPIPAPAVTWLSAQRCPSGAFSSDRLANPCSGLAVNYAGPDSNSTALALVGYAAAVKSPPTATWAQVKASQAASGGFAFYPGQPADPDSTALVVLGLDSVRSPLSADLGATKAAASLSYLRSTQQASGGVTYPGNPQPDVASTTEALWAWSGQPLWHRFDPSAARLVTG